MATAARLETPVATTACPLTGRETALERVPDPEFGAVSLDELETLARNEWRRRLGPDAYRREHSSAVVRALLVYALAPESPVREMIVRQLVLWELSALGGWGLGRAAVRHEFQALADAIRSTLYRTTAAEESARRLAEAVELKLAEVVGWDEPIRKPPAVQRERGHDGAH